SGRTRWRVLLVDDFEPLRRCIAPMLAADADLCLIGEASDGLVAVQMAAKLRPDLILLDISLPSLNGFEAARQIRRLAPNSRIVFLSQESYSEFVQVALDLGADGFVIKLDIERELLTAVKAVLRGERYISSDVKLTGSH